MEYMEYYGECYPLSVTKKKDNEANKNTWHNNEKQLTKKNYLVTICN